MEMKIVECEDGDDYCLRCGHKKGEETEGCYLYGNFFSKKHLYKSKRNQSINNKYMEKEKCKCHCHEISNCADRLFVADCLCTKDCEHCKPKETNN